MSMNDRRRYYRVVYPQPDRPKILINNISCAVHDICEMGIQFEANNLVLEKEFLGRLEFADGEQVEVRGSILRKIQERVVMVLNSAHCIPFSRIMKEQRQLLKKYRFFDATH
jgi:hypothetical protein